MNHRIWILLLLVVTSNALGAAQTIAVAAEKEAGVIAEEESVTPEASEEAEAKDKEKAEAKEGDGESAYQGVKRRLAEIADLLEDFTGYGDGEESEDKSCENEKSLEETYEAVRKRLGEVAEILEESASSAGEQARSGYEWLTSDLSAINEVEYKVVEVDLESESEEWEDILNELGQDGFNCFQAVPVNDKLRLLCKRQKGSVLGALPLADLIRLLPVLFGQPPIPSEGE